MSKKRKVGETNDDKNEDSSNKKKKAPASTLSRKRKLVSDTSTTKRESKERAVDAEAIVSSVRTKRVTLKNPTLSSAILQHRNQQRPLAHLLASIHGSGANEPLENALALEKHAVDWLTKHHKSCPDIWKLELLASAIFLQSTKGLATAAKLFIAMGAPLTLAFQWTFVWLHQRSDYMCRNRPPYHRKPTTKHNDEVEKFLLYLRKHAFAAAFGPRRILMDLLLDYRRRQDDSYFTVERWEGVLGLSPALLMVSPTPALITQLEKMQCWKPTVMDLLTILHENWRIQPDALTLLVPYILSDLQTTISGWEDSPFRPPHPNVTDSDLAQIWKGDRAVGKLGDIPLEYWMRSKQQMGEFWKHSGSPLMHKPDIVTSSSLQAMLKLAHKSPRLIKNALASHLLNSIRFVQLYRREYFQCMIQILLQPPTMWSQQPCLCFLQALHLGVFDKNSLTVDLARKRNEEYKRIAELHTCHRQSCELSGSTIPWFRVNIVSEITDEVHASRYSHSHKKRAYANKSYGETMKLRRAKAADTTDVDWSLELLGTDVLGQQFSLLDSEYARAVSVTHLILCLLHKGISTVALISLLQLIGLLKDDAKSASLRPIFGQMQVFLNTLKITTINNTTNTTNNNTSLVNNSSLVNTSGKETIGVLSEELEQIHWSIQKSLTSLSFKQAQLSEFYRSIACFVINFAS